MALPSILRCHPTETLESWTWEPAQASGPFTSASRSHQNLLNCPPGSSPWEGNTTGPKSWLWTSTRYNLHCELLIFNTAPLHPLTGSRSIPPGMKTMQFDIEEPRWDALMMNCDLIHVRLLYGSIQTSLWPQIYRNIFQYDTLLYPPRYNADLSVMQSLGPGIRLRPAY